MNTRTQKFLPEPDLLGQAIEQAHEDGNVQGLAESIATRGTVVGAGVHRPCPEGAELWQRYSEAARREGTA